MFRANMHLRVVICLLSLTGLAHAAQFYTYQNAASVLGQSSFTAATTGNTATRTSSPRGLAVDPATGKLFVADRDNNRVLRYSSTLAFKSGAAAELVLGQAAFGESGFSGVAADTMLIFLFHIQFQGNNVHLN